MLKTTERSRLGRYPLEDTCIRSLAVSASVALIEDERLVAQSFQNCGLTHSRTLLPMAEDLFANCGVSLDEIDAIAVAHGPGSFTGVRIGVATVKGLALGAGKPCVGVSTLEAMAWARGCWVARSAA